MDALTAAYICFSVVCLLFAIAIWVTYPRKKQKSGFPEPQAFNPPIGAGEYAKSGGRSMPASGVAISTPASEPIDLALTVSLLGDIEESRRPDADPEFVHPPPSPRQVEVDDSPEPIAVIESPAHDSSPSYSSSSDSGSSYDSGSSSSDSGSSDSGSSSD